MTMSVEPIAVSAGYRRLRALRWILVAGAMVVAAPGVADAKTARGAAAMGGGYDGIWNVLIITQAGGCDPAYSYTLQVSGGRISSRGPADISGSVGRGGGVAVRVSAGGSVATGTGRLGAGSGAGRWSGRGSVGVCSGRWEATRG